MKVVIKASPTWFGLYHCVDLLRFVGVSEDRRDKVWLKLADTWVEHLRMSSSFIHMTHGQWITHLQR